jgi:hypothetical protein
MVRRSQDRISSALGLKYKSIRRVWTSDNLTKSLAESAEGSIGSLKMNLL